MIRRMAVAVALAAGLLASGLASPAWAPRVFFSPSFSGTCSVPVNGSTATGSFAGAVTVDSFEARSGELVASVNLTGTCTVLGRQLAIAGEDVTSPASVDGSTCSTIHLELGSATVKDVTVDLSTANLTMPGSRKDRSLFCRIARAGANTPTAVLASWLNTLLAR